MGAYMKRWLRKLIVIVAIISILGIAAQILFGWFAWQTYVASIQPDSEFDPKQLPAAPDYKLASAWVVTPLAPGLSTLKPGGGTSGTPNRDAAADVFYIHPTTYFGTDNWNARIDEPLASEMLDNLVIPTQVSAFNICCRIYAPRYRQATFFAFLEGSAAGRQALEAAYDDVRRAFEYFIREQNEGRPFILVSHSQGTLHSIRLLEEVVAAADYRDRMVVAYLPGFSLPEDKRQTTLDWLPLCEASNSVRCLTAWDTYADSGGPARSSDKAEHYYPNASNDHWQPRRGKVATCVNPISWSSGTDKATKAMHEGWTYVLLPGLGSMASTPTLAALEENDLSATCREDGFLYISKPSSPVFEIGKMPGKWYHNHDINLFYGNIRDNAVARVAAFMNE